MRVKQFVLHHSMMTNDRFFLVHLKRVNILYTAIFNLSDGILYGYAFNKRNLNKFIQMIFQFFSR